MWHEWIFQLSERHYWSHTETLLELCPHRSWLLVKCWTVELKTRTFLSDCPGEIQLLLHLLFEHSNPLCSLCFCLSNSELWAVPPHWCLTHVSKATLTDVMTSGVVPLLPEGFILAVGLWVPLPTAVLCSNSPLVFNNPAAVVITGMLMNEAWCKTFFRTVCWSCVWHCVC